MLPPVPVTADLSVAQRAGGLAVDLRVHASPPRPLHWTLAARTRSGAGVSQTRQSGATDGASPRPVASLAFRADVSAVVTLSVSDAAGVETSRTCRIGETAEEGLSPC